MMHSKVGRIVLLVLLVMVAALHVAVRPAAAEEPVSYDIAGRWLMQGEGYGDRNSLRLQLRLDGVLDIRTGMVDNRRCVTGYDMWIRIDSTRVRIKTWQERYREELRVPIPLPELRPTLSSPLVLPAVKTREGLIYQVTLTSVTSGTVKIYGNIDLDVVGRTEINSECALWKEGSDKPDIKDLVSGCSVGAGAGSLLLLFPVALRRVRRRRG